MTQTDIAILIAAVLPLITAATAFLRVHTVVKDNNHKLDMVGQAVNGTNSQLQSRLDLMEQKLEAALRAAPAQKGP